MSTLGIICLLLATLSLAVTAAGIVLALKARGVSRVRKGAEVHAEMLAERVTRENRGRPTLAQAGVGYGTGIAWDRTAVYTLPEMRRAIGEGRYAAVLPVLLGMGGLLATIFFGGASVALLASGNFRYAGLIMLGIALYGTWMIASDYLKTKV